MLKDFALFINGKETHLQIKSMYAFVDSRQGLVRGSYTDFEACLEFAHKEQCTLLMFDNSWILQSTEAKILLLQYYTRGLRFCFVEQYAHGLLLELANDFSIIELFLEGQSIERVIRLLKDNTR